MADATKRSRLAWLAPLVAMAIGYAVGNQKQATAPVLPSHVATARAATPREPARATRPHAMPEQLRAMPAQGVPIAESFDALAERARAGDARASLRLLRELSLCDAEPGLEREAFGPHEKWTRVGTDDADVKRHEQAFEDRAERTRARARERYAKAQALCGDLTADEKATLGEWLERAADSGDPGAALCYVVMSTSDGYRPERYSDAWVDWMEQYRARAFDYAEHAFAAGYAQASWYLYYAAAGPHAISAFPVDHDRPFDLARAYALAQLQVALIERQVRGVDPDEQSGWRDSAAEIGAELGPGEIAQARQWAEAEASRIAANPPPDPPCELAGWP
jgi:hypothetical protein